MGIDFLTSSAGAARRLKAARARHARLQSLADARLAVARDRHHDDTLAAADVEAQAWSALMAIPGMTVGSAAEITGTRPSVVRRWIALASNPSICDNATVRRAIDAGRLALVDAGTDPTCN